MSITFRRCLYTFFIILFLIIAPLMILYAAGYKIKSGFILQKTGTLIVATKPKGAKIYLNNKLVQNFFQNILTLNKTFITSPAKIKNLSSGEYEVKLELGGYWPWQKRLNILPGQSTFAEDVYLFKQALPIIISPLKIEKIIPSPDQKELVILSNKQVDLFNLADEIMIVISTSTPGNINGLNLSWKNAWSPDQKKLILGKIIISLAPTTAVLDFEKLINNKVENLQWSNLDNNKIYYLANGQLNIYDFPDNKITAAVAEQKIIDYLVKNNYLYFITKNELSSDLKIWDINKNQLVGQINLPYSSYTIIDSDNKLLNLYDSGRQILYLINPFSPIKPLKEIINNISQINWIDNNNLLYANDFEIWLMDINSLNRKLLTRISDKIENIIWHPSNNYVIYATAKAINVLELDDREKYNITKLTELDLIKDVFLNTPGDTLYFYGEIGNQKGLYKLAIQ